MLFDGAFYQDSEMIPGPVILDNLIAKKKIRPMVAVFVKHEPLTRNKDLSCSEPFAAFLIKDLVPWVRAEYRVSEEPARTIVGGLSLGGLMASYCGLRTPKSSATSCRSRARIIGIRAGWSGTTGTCRTGKRVG